jgi:hypothetical protein
MVLIAHTWHRISAESLEYDSGCLDKVLIQRRQAAVMVPAPVQLSLHTVGFWILGLALVGCTVTDIPPTAQTDSAAADNSPPTAQVELTYQVHTVGHAEVHVVTVPPGDAYTLGVTLSEILLPLSEQAASVEAIAAINAGFFDPQNGLTTSFVTLAGALVGDPRQNPRLMDNPDLQNYLPAILDRSEFRIYACGPETRYEIVRHSHPLPPDCRLNAAVGAGPQLLPEDTSYPEAFVADNAAGERVRDALGSQTPNARSAVALTADGTVILAMAAQTDISPSGLTLSQMAEFLASLGAIAALNLDGGSSSGLYFDGTTAYGCRDSKGQWVMRSVKSILWVR